MADFGGVLTNSFLKDRTELLVAVGAIIVIGMLLIPLPAVMLDLLMAINLVMSLLVVLIVMYTRNALEFSVFPAFLLVLTVFGLALNVSSTRLILSQGAAFEGQIVQAFSNFVVGTSGTEGLVIGIIIFLIIIAVQFLVITKGATRISEVAARFTLDGLPGKQMVIEAEQSSGAITEEEATRRRVDLQREVDFYGAMDGASKFVQGNVTVGILITAINVIGGIIIGVTLQGATLGDAAGTYVALTIGDGLVTQFPALLVSTATGLIVSRSVSEGSFGSDVSEQFSAQSRVYWIAAVFLVVLAFLPGFPTLVLLTLAVLSAVGGYFLQRRQMKAEAIAKPETEAKAKPKEKQADVGPVAPLDPISMELGYGLVPLVDKDKGADLLDRVTKIRREAALDLGLMVPRIRIIDNMRLNPAEYALKIRGVEVGRGTIRMGHYLCINPGGIREELQGEKTTDPTFGLPAMWISSEQRDKAERAGYTVVDAPSIIATHLTEVVKQHASEILGRQEVRQMLDSLRGDYPAVVDDVLGSLNVGQIQKVLQGLLKEQVSIRNQVDILETLADYGGVTKDVGFLIEKTRQALGRQICLQYADESRTLRVVTVEPGLEQQIIDARMDTTSGPIAALAPDIQRAWIQAVGKVVRTVQEQGHMSIILCSESARPLVKSSTSREIPGLVVLSVQEIVGDVRVESLGEIRLEG